MTTQIRFFLHFILHGNYKVIMCLSEQRLHLRNAIGWEVELDGRYQDQEGFILRERVMLLSKMNCLGFVMLCGTTPFLPFLFF